MVRIHSFYSIILVADDGNIIQFIKIIVNTFAIRGRFDFQPPEFIYDFDVSAKFQNAIIETNQIIWYGKKLKKYMTVVIKKVRRLKHRKAKEP